MSRFRRSASLAFVAGIASMLMVPLGSPAHAAELTWEVRDTVIADEWYSVAYGEGIFVAVGYESTDGRSSVASSPDGITWTPRVPGRDEVRYTSVTYGNGRFVAVGAGPMDGKNIMTSEDGITWTPHTTPAWDMGGGFLYPPEWGAVTFGAGLFVAVASTAAPGAELLQVITSPDGITWTFGQDIPAVDGNDQNWYSVIRAEGRFIAAGAPLMTSADGITWTAETWFDNVDGDWKFVAEGNGRIVVLSRWFDNPSRIAVSTDGGTTWSYPSTPGIVADGTGVTFGNGLFHVTTTDGKLFTSADGTTWDGQQVADGVLRTVRYFDGLYIGVGESSSGDGLIVTAGEFTPPTDGENTLPSTGTNAVALLFLAGAMVTIGSTALRTRRVRG